MGGFKPGFTGTNEIAHKTIDDLTPAERERLMGAKPPKKYEDIETLAPQSAGQPGGKNRKWLSQR